MSDDEVQYIKVPTAIYEINGEEVHLPSVCLFCRQKGLVLMYNYRDCRMEAYCGPREDAKKRCIVGCDKISYVAPMTEKKFKIIAGDPNTTDYFFVMVTYPTADDLMKFLSGKKA